MWVKYLCGWMLQIEADVGSGVYCQIYSYVIYLTAWQTANSDWQSRLSATWKHWTLSTMSGVNTRLYITILNKIVIAAIAQNGASKEAIGLSIVPIYDSKCIRSLRDNYMMFLYSSMHGISWQFIPLMSVLWENEYFITSNLFYPFSNVTSCHRVILPVILLNFCLKESIFSWPFNILNTTSISHQSHYNVNNLSFCHTPFLTYTAV